MAKTGNPVRTDDPACRGGWYELTTGGFVCNVRDVIAFWGDRLPASRGTQANRTAALPYRYGRNRRDQAPMYRRMPTDEEAAEFEGYQIPGQAPADPTLVATDPNAIPVAPAPVEAVPTPAPTEMVPTTDVPPEEEEVVTLNSLAGDPHSALIRRMMSGFMVSLDRPFRTGGRRYWRTISNGFIPYQVIGGVGGPDFQGGALEATATLPIAFAASRHGVAAYTRTPDGRMRRGGMLERGAQLSIASEETIGTTVYYVAADGRAVRREDVRRIEVLARPSQIGPNDKWIDVNLSGQYIVAYEGDRPVYATLISSGKPQRPDPETNFLTPTGLFRIRAKHIATAMDGDVASDGPYSIEDVPWVMFFQNSYALHGAFWHDAFGYPHSHGCVNLAPRDAHWIFDWSDPPLPEGWHGIYPREGGPFTWVYVHGETPGDRTRRRH
jgi:hypothetical protein